jgi:hypothetical protein
MLWSIKEPISGSFKGISGTDRSLRRSGIPRWIRSGLRNCFKTNSLFRAKLSHRVPQPPNNFKQAQIYWPIPRRDRQQSSLAQRVRDSSQSAEHILDLGSHRGNISSSCYCLKNVVSGNFSRRLTGRGRVLLPKWRTNDAGVSFTLVMWVRIYRVGDAAILYHTRTKPRAAEVDGELSWGAA